MPGPEAKVEKHLDVEARKRGGMTMKMAPTMTGMPDRLVVLPGGQLYPVELKAKNGVLSERQKKVHHDFALRDYIVPVLSSVEAVDRWFTSLDLL